MAVNYHIFRFYGSKIFTDTVECHSYSSNSYIFPCYKILYNVNWAQSLALCKITIRGQF